MLNVNYPRNTIIWYEINIIIFVFCCIVMSNNLGDLMSALQQSDTMADESSKPVDPEFLCKTCIVTYMYMYHRAC